MIAPTINELEENYENSIDKVDYKKKTVLNRYGEFRYVNYTHCEMHPWLMLGIISSCFPFINHNYSVKNIVTFSQIKQAIGTYLTSYKDRMDISQVLYNPQLQLLLQKV